MRAPINRRKSQRCCRSCRCAFKLLCLQDGRMASFKTRNRASGEPFAPNVVSKLGDHAMRPAPSIFISMFAIAGVAFTANTGPSAFAQGMQQVSTRAGPLAVESLAKLAHPWAMAFLPNGHLLITEKPG